MKQIYDSFTTGRARKSVRFLLIALILMTFFSFSYMTSSVYGQTTPDVCRETQKVLAQYQNEYLETNLIFEISKNLNFYMGALSELKKGIRGGYVISGLDARFGKTETDIEIQEPLKDSILSELGTVGSSTKERLDFQSRLYTFLKQYTDEAAEVEDDHELQDKIDRIENQARLRKNRLRDLNCYEVLERESSTTKTSALNVSATWNFECCGGAYKGKLTLKQDQDKISGYFGETTNGTTGEIDGQISGTSLTFKRKWDGKEQDYNLTVSADGKKLTGSFSGYRNTSVGTDVTATRP